MGLAIDDLDGSPYAAGAAMQHLFFDLDGTLTDPAPGITACLVYAAQRLGRATPSTLEMRRYIGPPLREVFADLFETADAALIEEGVRSYRERFSTVGLFENAVYPGVERALEELRAKDFVLSLVTSKPTVYANRILDHFRLKGFFRHVYGAELSGERSTKRELIAHALIGEAIESSAACMIGDREHDILGAAAHRMAAVGVSWGYGTPDELRRAGANHVIDSVENLTSVVEKLRRRSASTWTLHGRGQRVR